MVKDIHTQLMNCNTPAEFVLFAKRHGATIRHKNHYFIKHKTGEFTSISCTPKPKIPLFKTKNQFINIYLKTKAKRKKLFGKRK